MTAADQALHELDISNAELNEMINAQPSLRAVLLGHSARLKLKRLMSSYATKVDEQDDHNRARRGSITVHYRGCEIAVRCCSVQSGSIHHDRPASFQCDASDKRPIELPNGNVVSTTCVLTNSFDIAAVSLFALTKKWDFAFIPSSKMRTLGSSSRSKLSAIDRGWLLATTHRIPFPIADPYTCNYTSLFDEIVDSQKKKKGKGKGKR